MTRPYGRVHSTAALPSRVYRRNKPPHRPLQYYRPLAGIPEDQPAVYTGKRRAQTPPSSPSPAPTTSSHNSPRPSYTPSTRSFLASSSFAHPLPRVPVNRRVSIEATHRPLPPAHSWQRPAPPALPPRTNRMAARTPERRNGLRNPPQPVAVARPAPCVQYIPPLGYWPGLGIGRQPAEPSSGPPTQMVSRQFHPHTPLPSHPNCASICDTITTITTTNTTIITTTSTTPNTTTPNTTTFTQTRSNVEHERAVRPAVLYVTRSEDQMLSTIRIAICRHTPSYQQRVMPVVTPTNTPAPSPSSTPEPTDVPAAMSTMQGPTLRGLLWWVFIKPVTDCCRYCCCAGSQEEEQRGASNTERLAYG